MYYSRLLQESHLIAELASNTERKLGSPALTQQMFPTTLRPFPKL